MSATEKDLNFTLIDRILDFEFPIDPISAYDTYKSLGTVQGISEKQEDQLKVLMKKAQAQFFCVLIHSTATQGQAWIHHKMCFIPSVGYPLQVCHISNKKLHSLQKQYLRTLKNKLGFIRTHSHDFSFGPRSYGGLGMSDLRF